MEIDMRENILGTRFTGLESTILPMAIATRDHGTKVGSRVLVCIHSGVAIEDVENGTQEHSRPLYLLSLNLSFGQLRQLEGHQKMPVTLGRWDEQVSKAVMAAKRAATAARVAAVKAVQNRMDGKFCDLGV